MNMFPFSQTSDASMGLIDKSRPLLGRLPNWERKGGRSCRKIKRMNRFLWWQSERINKAASEGKWDKAFFMWSIMLKTSISYQLLLFHRSKPNWYWAWNQVETRRKFQEAMNTIRRWDFEMLVKRFYIPKRNGKFRPIGAPNLSTKMVSKALADMLLYYAGDIPRQHGFSRGKGIHTAIMNIWDNYAKGLTCMYEFDLKGWFNHVRPIWVMNFLKADSPYLSELFGQITYRSRIVFRELKSEAELTLLRTREDGVLDIKKEGITQGLPHSPVAANLALASQEYPEGLVMYADDGIFMSNQVSMPDWLYKIRIVGAKLALEKSGWIDGTFKFLGLTLNFKEKYIAHEGEVFNWKNFDPDTRLKLENWLRKHNLIYPGQNNSTPWSWDVVVNSYLWNRGKNPLNLRGLNYLVPTIISWWTGKAYKGLRWFPNRGLVDIIGSSSVCLNMLTENLCLIHKARIKPFIKSSKMVLSKNRGHYIEHTPIEYSPTGHHMIIKESMRIRSVKDWIKMSD